MINIKTRSDHEIASEARKILSKCNFSKIHTKTIESPFFIPVYDSITVEDIINNNKTKDNSQLINIFNSVNLPKIIYHMYLLLDSNTREFTYNNFTFFSIEVINKRLKVHQNNNITEICDIGCKHYGMGHVIVLSWNKKINSFIFRRDGGENEHVRIDNWNFIKSYDPGSTPNYIRVPQDKLFSVLLTSNLEDLRELFINK